MLFYISCWPVRVVVLYPEDRDVTLKQSIISFPVLFTTINGIVIIHYFQNIVAKYASKFKL
jgi:hypothetical protein